ncbi:MAG: hypothetical protein F6K31_23540 [Symploca sp. SIO2G7]|nr:hypothetical protein [Symploca sp. SIO2G7]
MIESPKKKSESSHIKGFSPKYVIFSFSKSNPTGGAPPPTNERNFFKSSSFLPFFLSSFLSCCLLPVASFHKSVFNRRARSKYIEITKEKRKMVIPLPHLLISPSGASVRPVRPVRLLTATLSP